MKYKTYKLAITLILLAGFIIPLADAEVGVGISPSRAVLQIEGGKTQDLSLLVFDSGDGQIKISMSAEGSIADFTKFNFNNVVLEPEPKPHALPIKNGKNIIATFSPPVTSETKKYVGTIAASGSPAGNSQFGGGVGVAAQIEITVTPTQSVLAFIPPLYFFILLIIILIIAIVFLLKRAGFELKLERKTKDPYNNYRWYGR